MKRHVYAGALSACLVLGGCYSSLSGVDAGGQSDAGGDDAGDDGGESQSLCETRSPVASPIRRLTAFEYDNTIEDLLGDTSNPASTFPEEGGSGFDNNADVSSVSRLLAQKYMSAAEDLSDAAVADLGTLLPCDPAADERGCVRTWVEQFGHKAWRRPLDTTEVDDMMALFDANRGTFDVPTSVGVVLQAFLQSPHFIYRVEFGVDATEQDGAVELADYEMASRLSYFLWGSMPDDALLAAAGAGELHTPGQVADQARRMLDDPKTRRMANHFYEQWLGYLRLEVLEKDTETFPAYGPNIAALQRQEVDAFIDHVVWEENGTVKDLLTAPYTLVNPELAQYYGLPAPAGTGFEPVTDPNVEQAGILTQGGIMAVFAKSNQTSPIARGLFVREHLLCQIPPPPPDDVDVRPPPPDPNATTRERFAQHRDDPACAGCHNLMDPLGFGLENFDATGRWRTDENGLEIDVTGEIVATDVDGPFDGARDLASRLADSQTVKECVTRQWFRYAYGRTESEADDCNLETIDEQLTASDYNLQEMLVALTQTDAFLFRTKVEGGAP